MKKDIKPFLFFSIIASLLVGHLANRTALIFEGLTGNLVENINAAIDAIIPALQNNPFMIGTSKTALISGAIGAACVWLIFLYNVFGAKNFMRGSEHGSARWGTAKDIKPLTDREPDMNIPLSATEQISVRKVKDFEADRNKNIVVAFIGAIPFPQTAHIPLQTALQPKPELILSRVIRITIIITAPCNSPLTVEKEPCNFTSLPLIR